MGYQPVAYIGKAVVTTEQVTTAGGLPASGARPGCFVYDVPETLVIFVMFGEVFRRCRELDFTSEAIAGDDLLRWFSYVPPSTPPLVSGSLDAQVCAVTLMPGSRLKRFTAIKTRLGHVVPCVP
jgi:hypothetical protein